jgi:hypothetical protein
MFLSSIHCPVCFSKHNFSETGFCLRLQVETTQLGPIDRASVYTPSWCWHRCPEIGTSSIDWAQLSRFHLKTETESSLRNVVFWCLWIKTGRCIMSKNITFCSDSSFVAKRFFILFALRACRRSCHIGKGPDSFNRVLRRYGNLGFAKSVHLENMCGSDSFAIPIANRFC